jgi:hypothetical protein
MAPLHEPLSLYVPECVLTARSDPMALRVKRVQDLRTGGDLIEALAGVEARIVRQPNRELAHRAELSERLTALVQPGLAAFALGSP